MTKACTTCKQELPLDEFYKDNRTGRPRGRCKTCHSTKSYESRRGRPDHVNRQRHENRIQAIRKFGITPAEYRRLEIAQEGKCAICKEPETAMSRGRTLKLAIDHDHTTGRVRGLLCMRCNTALGKFKDDPAVLQAAIDYLHCCG